MEGSLSPERPGLGTKKGYTRLENARISMVCYQLGKTMLRLLVPSMSMGRTPQKTEVR
jgi:hypothetical protein